MQLRTGTNYRDRYGNYEWGAKRLPAVSGSLRVLNKPQLIDWAAKEVATKIKTLCVRRASGELNANSFLAMLQDTENLSKVHNEKRDDKADLGSALHDIAKNFADGRVIDLKTYNKDVRAYTASLLNCLQVEKIKFIYSECTVLSFKWNYAGTLDGIIEWNGKRYLIDYKTSRGTWPEHCLQLAAYRYAEYLGIDFESCKKIPMPKVAGCLLFEINPSETIIHEWKCTPADFEVFLSLRLVKNWLDGRPSARKVLRCGM